jgi:hypothetical protein
MQYYYFIKKTKCNMNVGYVCIDGGENLHAIFWHANEPSDVLVLFS